MGWSGVSENKSICVQAIRSNPDLLCRTAGHARSFFSSEPLCLPLALAVVKNQGNDSRLIPSLSFSTLKLMSNPTLHPVSFI